MHHPTFYIEHFFYWLGTKIGKYHVQVIVLSLITTAILSSGMVYFVEDNNVRSEYSPLNAPSQKEYAIAKSFLKQNGTMDPCYIMTHADDNGDLLREEYRWTIYNMTRALQTEVKVTKNGKEYGFTDLCEPYCELNTAFLAFLKLYDPDLPSTHTYPSIELFGTQAFIGNNVYGIKLKEGTDVLESFNTVVLPFYLVADYEDQDVLIGWIHEAIKLFELPEYSTILKTGMTGDNLVTYEVRRMGSETAPLIVGSITAMIIFVVIFSFRTIPVQSKPWEAFIGCIIPILALIASLGLLSAFGMKFQAICVAALFLVLSVGVDDLFIIMRAWDRSDPTMSILERTGLTLEDAGPSITISALTNIMSFAIGATSDTPAVKTFCLFSAVAITVCYLYQLILFTAIIALSGRRERKGYQAIFCCFKANPQDRSSTVEYFSKLHDWIVETWGTAVTKWPVRTLLFIIMILYFYISWIGITRMSTKISIDKMALPDSYLHDFQNTFETALRNMQPISVFVMNPGDLRDADNLQRTKNLVHDFEQATNSYGPDSTFFWLTPYEEFLRFYGETDEFTYAEIPTFFKSATYFYLSSFVHYNETACLANEPECITSFFFITNFHKVIKYHELVPAVKDWRRIAAKYSDMQVYPYSDHLPFVDQTMSIDGTVVGSVACALLCTAVICFIFIPHFLSVVSAVFSVFSISWGIFGFLSLWDVDLDPLSMAALLMAIGFSVDFTAHISFHYYKAPETNPRKRIINALGIIGWPMTQVGFSTIVALLPLLFKQSYLAIVFLKTIIVVVTLGMFHGLIFLPAILTMVTKYSPITPSSSADSSERSSQRSSDRKESFYKSQNLIKSINEFNWLSHGKKPSTEKLRKSVKKSLSIKAKVEPISASDLANTVSTPPTAMIHKIPLGRTHSNAL